MRDGDHYRSNLQHHTHIPNHTTLTLTTPTPPLTCPPCTDTR